MYCVIYFKLDYYSDKNNLPPRRIILPPGRVHLRISGLFARMAATISSAVVVSGLNFSMYRRTRSSGAGKESTVVLCNGFPGIGKLSATHFSITSFSALISFIERSRALSSPGQRPRSIGRMSLRRKLRRKSDVRFEESTIYSRFLYLRYDSISLLCIVSSGRSMVPVSVTIPFNPVVPEPRSRLRNIVSMLSSALCPVAILSALY